MDICNANKPLISLQKITCLMSYFDCSFKMLPLPNYDSIKPCLNLNDSINMIISASFWQVFTLIMLNLMSIIHQSSLHSQFNTFPKMYMWFLFNNRWSKPCSTSCHQTLDRFNFRRDYIFRGTVVNYAFFWKQLTTDNLGLQLRKHKCYGSRH